MTIDITLPTKLSGFTQTTPTVIKPDPQAKIAAVAATTGKQLPEKETHVATKVSEAVTKLNEHAQSIRRELEFSFDEDTDQVVVKVIDQDSKQVIRQMPTEEALRFALRLQEMSPQLFDESA